MITGQSYGAPTGTAGSPAIKLKDIDAEWVLIIMVTEPTMPFSGMSRETNIIPGDLQKTFPWTWRGELLWQCFAAKNSNTTFTF